MNEANNRIVVISVYHSHFKSSRWYMRQEFQCTMFYLLVGFSIILLLLLLTSCCVAPPFNVTARVVFPSPTQEHINVTWTVSFTVLLLYTKQW